MHKHMHIVAIIIAIFFTVKSDVLMWELSPSSRVVGQLEKTVDASYTFVDEELIVKDVEGNALSTIDSIKDDVDEDEFI